jgi:Tol biopolymer transport system component
VPRERGLSAVPAYRQHLAIEQGDEMRIPSVHFWRALAALALFASLAACDPRSPTIPDPDPDPPGTDDPSAPATIELSPGYFEFPALGVGQRATATVKNSAGVVLGDAVVAWASTDPAVVTVDASGGVVSVANGTAKVVATSGEAADTAVVVVAQVARSIVASPRTITLDALGATATATALVRDAHEVEIEGAEVAWSSTDPGVATASSGGVVEAVSAGSAGVIATAGPLADTIAVTVDVAAELPPEPDEPPVPYAIQITPGWLELPEGGTGQLTAVVVDEDGDPIEGVEVTWSSDDDAIATVDGTGRVKAQRWGSKVAIIATAGALDAAVSVRVLDQIAFSYSGQIHLMNEDGSGRRPVTKDGGYSPVWSPDGRRIAYMRVTAGKREIRLIDADGTGDVSFVQASNHNDFQRYEWSPDGESIVYEVGDTDAQRDIWVKRVGAAAGTNLTVEPSLRFKFPAWSPDGREIAYQSRRQTVDAVEYNGIFVMKANGTDERALTSGGKRDPFMSPVRGPDGSTIGAAGYDQIPVWSPDGGRVAFERINSLGIWQVHVVNSTDGGGMITVGPGGNPQWSPDGKTIAFGLGFGANQEVHLYDVTAANTTQLSFPGQKARVPVWSPDGSRVLYQDMNSALLYVHTPGGTRIEVGLAEPAAFRPYSWRPRP